MKFEQALKNHLEMVQTRNLIGFEETVVKDDRLTLIMPNGKLLEGFDSVQAFHKDWFSDPDWSIETSLLNTFEGKDLSTALLKVNYNDLDAEGKPYSLEYYLSLTFVYELDNWLLVLDQNTMLPK